MFCQHFASSLPWEIVVRIADAMPTLRSTLLRRLLRQGLSPLPIAGTLQTACRIVFTIRQAIADGIRRGDHMFS